MEELVKFGKQIQSLLGTEVNGYDNINSLKSDVKSELGCDAEAKALSFGFDSFKDLLNSKEMRPFVEVLQTPLYYEVDRAAPVTVTCYKAKLDHSTLPVYLEQVKYKRESERKEKREKRRQQEMERALGIHLESSSSQLDNGGATANRQETAPIRLADLNRRMPSNESCTIAEKRDEQQQPSNRLPKSRSPLQPHYVIEQNGVLSTNWDKDEGEPADFINYYGAQRTQNFRRDLPYGAGRTFSPYGLSDSNMQRQKPQKLANPIGLSDSSSSGVPTERAATGQVREEQQKQQMECIDMEQQQISEWTSDDDGGDAQPTEEEQSKPKARNQQQLLLRSGTLQKPQQLREEGEELLMANHSLQQQAMVRPMPICAVPSRPKMKWSDDEEDGDDELDFLDAKQLPGAFLHPQQQKQTRPAISKKDGGGGVGGLGGGPGKNIGDDVPPGGPVPIVPARHQSDAKLISVDDDEEGMPSSSGFINNNNKTTIGKPTSTSHVFGTFLPNQLSALQLNRSNSNETLATVTTLSNGNLGPMTEGAMAHLGKIVSEWCKYQLKWRTERMVKFTKLMDSVAKMEPYFEELVRNGTVVDFLRHYCPELDLLYPPPDNELDEFYLKWIEKKADSSRGFSSK